MRRTKSEIVRITISELKDATQIIRDEISKEVTNLIKIDKYIPLIHERRSQVLNLLILPNETEEDFEEGKEYTHSDLPDHLAQAIQDFDDALLDLYIKTKYQIKDYEFNETDFDY